MTIDTDGLLAAWQITPPDARGVCRPDLALRVRRMVNERGEAPTADAMGVSRAGLWRVLAGLSLHRRTAEDVSRRLEAAGL